MITTMTAYQMVTRNLTQSLERTAAKPTVANETAYFEKNIGKVKSLDDFMKDDRLYRYAVEAYGLGDRVKLLDGGRKLWEAKGLPLDTATPEAAKGSVELTPVNAKVRARLGDVLKVAEGDAGSVLLDIRSPDEFSGKIIAPEGSKELSIRAGHVPGAKNVPWSKAVNQHGTLKAKDELNKLFADAGVDGSKPVIVYCRIGERSSHTWFVLSKVLGYDVKNYDGSWTEYGNSVGVPVANLTGTVWQGK